MFYFDLPIQIQSLLNHYWLIINYALIFLLLSLAYITYKKPALACGLLIILFPTYLFRAKIFGIPTTFLELAFILIFLIWIIKIAISNQQSAIQYKNSILYPIILLIIASTISIFIAPNALSALGLWKAYFIEPILFFIILINTIRDPEDKKTIFWCMALSSLPIALLAMFQKFTGWGIAEPMWVAPEQRRVTSVFTSPNAVGLYLGPIAVMCFGWLIEKIKNQKSKIKIIEIFIILLLNTFAILFTKSQGTLIGVAAGIIFLCYFLLNKKWTILCSAIGIILLLFIPQAQKLIMPYATFSDTAGQNRIILWKGSIDYLFASPKNFFFGSGLYGFPRVQEQFRDPKKTEPLIYPHNIFLNFWMDTGLLGLIAIIMIFINFFTYSIKKIGNWKPACRRGRLEIGNFIPMAAMITVIVHGFVDVPYFKNDLSLLFWTIISLAYII